MMPRLARRRDPRHLALVAVALSTFTALAACGSKAEDVASIEVRVLDEEGNPAPWAQVLYRSSAGSLGDALPRWDATSATLTLPKAGAPHAIRVAAPGRKTQLIEGIDADRIVKLAFGFPIEIHATGDASPPEPPRVLLFRVRPATEGDPTKDERAAARIGDVAAFVYPRAGPRANAGPPLPTRGWGYAASVSDAATGLLLPEAGAYEVHWGVFDTAHGIWQGAPGPAHRVEVNDRGREALRIDVSIDAATMQSVRRALRARIDALGASEIEAAHGAETE